MAVRTTVRHMVSRLQKWEKDNKGVEKKCRIMSIRRTALHCTVCCQTFPVAHCGLTDLKQHAPSDEHIRNIRKTTNRRTLWPIYCPPGYARSWFCRLYNSFFVSKKFPQDLLFALFPDALFVYYVLIRPQRSEEVKNEKCKLTPNVEKRYGLKLC